MDERKKNEAKTRKMNTFANGLYLFNFRWQNCSLFGGNLHIADDSMVAAFVPMASISDGFSDSFKYEERSWRDVKSGFTHFADGDVAVAKISPCLENRKSFVAKALPNGIGAGTTELFVFRSRHILPDYTLLFFKSDCFISACVGTFNGVVGQQRAARNVIEEMMFPIPPIPEQSRIVEIVEELFGEIDEIERGRLFVKANIEAAKSRILDLAIHGKLVPQDPSDEPATTRTSPPAELDSQLKEFIDQAKALLCGEEYFEVSDIYDNLVLAFDEVLRGEKGLIADAVRIARK